MKIQHKPTPNTYPLDTPPVTLVLHTTLGSFDGAVQWLRTTPEQRQKRHGKKSYSSAHVVFGRYGEIAELAGVDVGTWHAGGVSKPSKRAKEILPKNVLGRLKNPNKSTIGLEFASGYDIDKDGVIESWEKLYTKSQIKASVWYVLNRLEPQILEKYGVKIEFSDDSTITHKDIASYKPDLEIQRSMFLAELNKQRSKTKPPVIVEPEQLEIKDGESFTVEVKDSRTVIIKKT